MADKFDFMMAADGDLLLSNGDMVFGAANGQLLEALLVIEPGELKHEPLVGCGLSRWILDDEIGSDAMKAIILEQFTADGAVIEKMDLSNAKNAIVKGKYL